jgi:hypothetical protein
MRTIGALASAGTTIAMLATLTVGVASADPVPAGDRPIALVGSETTTPVMNALANDATALAIGGTRQVASFNATGSATIDTHAGTIPACTAIARPDGSSLGRAALLNSLNANAGAGDGCIQGSRSSSAKGTTSTTPDLTWIPFAEEGISFAITNTSNFPKNMTLTRLKQFFQCTRANLSAGGSPFTTGRNYRVMLPQNGSGTRSYWITTMDYAGASITVPNSGAVATTVECIENGADESGTAIQEHDGRSVNNFEIVPFSVAQYVSQAAGVTDPNDFRANVRIGQLDIETVPGNGIVDYTLNPFSADFTLARKVYNLFPTALINQASPASGSLAEKLQTLFKGNTSQICTNASAQRILLRYGFRTIGTLCGDTTDVS